LAFGKGLNVFLAMIFGSLGLRAIIVMVSAWYCLSVISMHQVAFSLTFAISCFVFLLAEIFFFSSVLRERQAAIAQTGDGSLEKKNL